MKNFISKILPSDRRRLWIAAGFIVAALVISIIWDQKMAAREPSSEKSQAESVETAATYIPDGFVLVPIEVANFESLDSILGKFGVVDLFVGSDDPRVKPHKVAERVKILRAPLNPNHFAVLVPDSESQKIVAYSGALTVVVQNPNKAGPTFVMSDSTQRSPRLQAKHSRVTVEVLHVE